VTTDQSATPGAIETPETAEPPEAEEPPEAPRKRAHGIPFKILLPAIVLIDVAAYVLFPPFPKGGHPGEACAYPVCFINGSIEFPPPATVIGHTPDKPGIIFFAPSISSTLLTLWLVMAVLIVVVRLATLGMRLRPGPVQNAVEFAYESLANFAESLGGAASRPYVPIFAAFFLLILFCNWSGLVPPVGKIEQLRAPTSDVNVTIGLALTSFTIFEFEGFHRLGVRGYLGKFFPIGEFRHGLGDGLIAMLVGLVELLLEFVKPVTLSMRLFGNIYGGELAVGVISALTIAFIPVLLYGLEFLLNVIQAIIFSTLTLVFILIAIEGHGTEEHAVDRSLAGGGALPGPTTAQAA
jgi:F-type H+-transporting ATPase subunit a